MHRSFSGLGASFSKSTDSVLGVVAAAVAAVVAQQHRPENRCVFLALAPVQAAAVAAAVAVDVVHGVELNHV